MQIGYRSLLDRIALNSMSILDQHSRHQFELSFLPHRSH